MTKVISYNGNAHWLYGLIEFGKIYLEAAPIRWIENLTGLQKVLELVSRQHRFVFLSIVHHQEFHIFNNFPKFMSDHVEYPPLASTRVALPAALPPVRVPAGDPEPAQSGLVVRGVVVRADSERGHDCWLALHQKDLQGIEQAIQFPHISSKVVLGTFQQSQSISSADNFGLTITYLLRLMAIPRTLFWTGGTWWHSRRSSTGWGQWQPWGRPSVGCLRKRTHL